MLADAENGRVGRAAANVHVRHLAKLRCGISGGARAAPRYLGFHIRPGNGHHKIPRQIRDGCQYLIPVPGAGNFTSDNDCPRFNLFWRYASGAIGGFDYFGQARRVNLVGLQ